MRGIQEAENGPFSAPLPTYLEGVHLSSLFPGIFIVNAL